MKKELADKWVADLRANPDKQGHGRLYDGEGKYCCLGRLALIMGGHFEYSVPMGNILGDVTNKNCLELHYKGKNTNACFLLPYDIIVDADINSSVGFFTGPNSERREECLAGLNDGGKTFAYIADIIEANWEKI